MIMLLWRLILALFISDFVLQFNWIIRHKSELKGLFMHVLIYIAVSILLVSDILSFNLLIMVLALGIVHIATDILKNALSRKFEDLGWLWFLLDQTVHLSSIIIGVMLFSNSVLHSMLGLWNALDKTLLLQYGILFIINLMGGKFFTESIIKSCKINETASPNDNNLHAIIGVFERLLITLSVLIGKYEIIGFMIAAKSIIRLPEAKTLDQRSDAASHKMVNYYLIGTFVSYSWAIAWAVLFIRFIRY